MTSTAPSLRHNSVTGTSTTDSHRRRLALFSCHHNTTSHLDYAAAEKLLANGDATERKKAAVVLGKLKSASSYGTLVTALQRTDNPRDVQVAILTALKSIGNKYGYDARFSCGREPLEKFAIRHISDAGLVKLACEALESTGTYDEIDAVSERISAAAGTNYPASASAASSLYLCFLN